MFKDLENTTESRIIYDYDDIFAQLKERGITFSQLKETLALSENCFQAIKNHEIMPFEDEAKIKTYLDIKSTFMKKEYYFEFPSTSEGISDKWKAIKLFEKMKAHRFSILVDRNPKGENRYKIIGNIGGTIYEREEHFAYDTSAIIVFYSYIEEYLS